MSSQPKQPGAKGANYHKECTGEALETAKAHSQPSELVLFGACFCPFVHRVWIALEAMHIPYQYVEVDPYAKPKALLDLNPRGLVPALKLGKSEGKGLGESTVIMEYLEEAYSLSSTSSGDHPSLLPPLSDAYSRALARLAADKLNRNLIPAFYRYLQAQTTEKQIEGAKDFLSALHDFIDSMHPPSSSSAGFWNGSKLSWTDVMVAPWLFRATNVLRHFRGFEWDKMIEGQERKDRFRAWTQAVFAHEAFRKTTSSEELYLDSYVRYAENRPNTSQVANAINSGRALP
ncbi:uncharacterized protein PFL1_06748 [Pseudozyma flocculosa PF-1]|uniref:Related to glutathione-S-transferase n=2 Tax=Pseudozyma flocculosa TaxID=84751 RepID=A0A5C3F7S4_9BASI|nr:uncharacterized protein PFL1_06748 [Pseudozyma flocculosa PF-1]EPQ25676.1 hypothetical protein PFL1_06748 [Pseudozyma flocculosa PF-1]SPO40452.1 related to glutathione-S-transferase [Pseudozyma flocculosa]